MQDAVPDGMDAGDVQLYKEAFPLFDLDGDGVIGAEEMKGMMVKMGFDATDAEVAKLMQALDPNDDGGLSFQTVLKEMATPFPNDAAKEADQEACFKLFANESGFISEKEIAAVMTALGETMTSTEIEEMISQVTDDKFIDFAAFQKLLAVRPRTD